MLRDKVRTSAEFERRSVLELLVLGAAKTGPINSYVLYRDWGISAGASIPALRRLTKLGLLTCAASKERGTGRYTLSPEGIEALSRSIRQIAVAPAVSDASSALRIVTLANLLGMEELIKVCPLLLKATASILRGSADIAQMNADFEHRDRTTSARLHRWLFLQTEAARLRGEAEALEKMADDLPPAGTITAGAGHGIDAVDPDKKE